MNNDKNISLQDIAKDRDEVLEESTSSIVEKNIKSLYHSKKEPRKALSVYFRNQNKFITSSLSIADKKAMIMIRVNSLIVSAAILFYRYIIENLAHGMLIGVVLIIGTGSALVIAVLAAKPSSLWLKNFFDKNIYPHYPDIASNNFMPLRKVSLAEYEESMDKVVNSQELQIGNQVRFAYLMENYLAKKYKLLDIAYNIFIGCFIIIAIIFVAGLLV